MTTPDPANAPSAPAEAASATARADRASAPLTGSESATARAEGALSRDRASVRSTDAARAEGALFARLELACAAARAAGLPGEFDTWRPVGGFAVLATDPALRHLCTLSGVDGDGWADDPRWRGITPVRLGPPVPGHPTGTDRLLALRPLTPTPPPPPAVTDAPPPDPDEPNVTDGPPPDPDVTDAPVPGGPDAPPPDVPDVPSPKPGGPELPVPDPDVSESDAAEFVPLLLAGYQVTGPVAAFIAAEHSAPDVHRYVLRDPAGTPIAAAALTLHGDVAVLGGAATLPAHRARGAQSRLLTHRLAVAASLGATLAVATAAPHSPSARNLTRAAFTPHPRPILPH